MDDFKPEFGDPLHKPREGSLVGKFGAEGSCVRAQADRAVVELRAECSVCLAGEGDLVSAWRHGDYLSSLVIDADRQRALAAASGSSPEIG